MDDFGLLSICASAFTGVFFLLSLLAVVMRILTAAFPAVSGSSDSPSGPADQMIVAAITSAAASTFPGARVAKIEEKI